MHRASRIPWYFTVATLAGAAIAACAQGVQLADTGAGGAGGEASGTAGTGPGTGTSSTGPTPDGGSCTPGSTMPCYTGPAGTEGVGACKPGSATCLPGGDGFGPCEGDVVPVAESCATPEDDDCDGTVNQPAAGCGCVPGAPSPCYDGPQGTEGVGLCAAGTAICAPDGLALGPCTKEVLPALENCDTPEDDDCDGKSNEPEAGCGPDACANCTDSPVGGCASSAIVVGHYEGGARTVCIGQGDGTPFELALMSYETTSWTLGGAIGRLTSIQIYTVDAFGSIAGNGNVPTAVQVGGSVPADPYAYAASMGDCPAHTGYAAAVFGVPEASVCHMEKGLPQACGYPSYSCLAISP